MDSMSLNFSIGNFSDTLLEGRNVNQILIDKFQRNRNIEDPAYHILIGMYGVLILLGAVGNTLVVVAVARKPIMRSARNMFIVNLAVSGKIGEFLGNL